MGGFAAIGHCPDCNDHILFQCRRPHHLLHLALTVITQGIWLPVWLLLVLRSRQCACTRCGHLRSKDRLITTPLRSRLPTAVSGLALPTGAIHSRLEFHSYLVRNNLVYYMPTSR